MIVCPCVCCRDLEVAVKRDFVFKLLPLPEVVQHSYTRISLRKKAIETTRLAGRLIHPAVCRVHHWTKRNMDPRWSYWTGPNSTGEAGIMEQRELPVLLVNEVGGVRGVLEAHMEFLKKHFHLITMKEFLKNKKHWRKKVQAIYLWWHKPIIDRELLESLPDLKVIANSGVGMDHLDLKLISSFGVKMANAPHAVSSSTADTGMALLLASARRLVEGCQIAVSPDTVCFAADWLGDEVNGATLGIIGMGRIGYKVALRAKAFEMKILYHNRNRRTEEEEQAVGAIYCTKIEDLLQQSDFVMLVMSLTPQTHKLFGKKELELMKPTATLINISRGPVVDQDALVEALQTGVIKAAALDVTYPEPLPRDHPLLKLKNILITPHLGIKTDKATRMITEEAVANILAALNGLPMPNEVFP
ncbi:glyoxylate/hydroxypyruvate reductase B-like isoform X2 [Malaclemys terrapin pileata]|uniref:glyoxylate/hydroxypyruvate reductase B-like isoform X2 n=1 Tax=Malaclemys terrapin pileata TaxID=2991368 RepID=UPI0023A86134|nr:glyoxylate/hydroxypyruvate reductase B-like isoform X2 [Malaclemys terrapin pileata]